MNRIIDWMLFSDNKLLIKRDNVMAIYNMDNNILYKTDDESNEYLFKEKRFIRITDEYTMEIDFSKKLCKFIFEKEGSCQFDITCEYHIIEDQITLKYNLDDSQKKIIIKLKEIID